MTTMESRPESRSWAEMVQTIDRERKCLPWDPTKAEPVKRASMWERKKAEREFDVVSMAYRNPEKQEAMVQRKAERERAKLEQVEQLTSTTFNIVSHQGPPRRIETMIAAQKSKGMPPRPYNCLTNLSIEDHQNAPLLYDETYTITRAGKPKEVRSTVGKHDREFSIVNNNYYENHDSKKRQEYDRFKEHTLERYWATHDYDPIRGKYYDAEKEQNFRENRQMLTQVHGLAKTLRVAPSIQYAEGNCYDILNHTIHDDGKCTIADAVAERSLHRIKRPEKEQAARQSGELKSSFDDKRRLGRVSYKRWEGPIDRGFDFIKNTVTPADQPAPLPSRPVSMWARLQTTTDSLSGTADSRAGLTGTTPSNNPSRVATAAGAGNPGTTRVRNLSGAGPQFTELRVDLKTRDTFPASPMTKDGDGFNNRNYNSSSGRKPMTASRRNVVESNGVAGGNSNGNGVGASARSSRAATAAADGGRSHQRAVPSLDLTRTEPPEPVRYVEPTNGPMGLSVPIVPLVRTGGLSGLRD